MTTKDTERRRAKALADPERLRSNREATLRDECARANTAISDAAAAVRRRDEDLADWQGPRTEGKFSYTELAAITGLSRSRVNQIITAVRRRREALQDD